MEKTLTILLNRAHSSRNTPTGREDGPEGQGEKGHTSTSRYVDGVWAPHEGEEAV